ncbi:hypothetical protein Trydic_g7578 [Trypoxylus dichotomus]
MSSANGIGQHIAYLVMMCLLLFAILFIIEYRFADFIIYEWIAFVGKSPPDEGTTDRDVLLEKQRVRNDTINHNLYEVVLKDVTKYYGNSVVVNQLCLGIKRSQCFGLLGLRGAGKTSVFQMMTGETRFSCGEAWISDTNLRTHLRKAYKHIGYCPQNDALIEDLTGKETLVIFCLIRGIPLGECAATAKQLAREFRFYDYIDQRISQYSVGNKRKLSTALALIGEPQTILLDEPTTGMDFGSKRFLWNALTRIRDNGKCLILVSRFMEECEAICTRVGIMVNGALQCLGAPHRLKTEFSDLHLLIVKLKTVGDMEKRQEDINEINSLVSEHFETFHRVEGNPIDIIYILREVKVPMSKMFAVMEKAKEEMEAIFDYSISHFGLEQIFFVFTQRQLEEQ